MTSGGEPGLGLLWFGMFHHPAWAVGSYISGHQPGELPKSKSTQPRFATRWVTLYLFPLWLKTTQMILALRWWINMHRTFPKCPNFNWVQTNIHSGAISFPSSSPPNNSRGIGGGQHGHVDGAAGLDPGGIGGGVAPPPGLHPGALVGFTAAGHAPPRAKHLSGLDDRSR